MSKKDRTIFMKEIAKPDTYNNIPKIFNKHYHKFNYAYAIVDHIESFSEIRKQIKDIDTVDLEDGVSIDIQFKSSTVIEKAITLIDEYIDKNNGDVSANVEKISSNKLNISINTNFIEEDMYDDNRLDTDKKIYNGKSS